MIANVVIVVGSGFRVYKWI